ncbi:MAG: ABC transporter permease [Thermodesulfobacteriota bacterium]|nr:ABC transporter permease [Thermodesulfobacteriota bacterium]
MKDKATATDFLPVVIYTPESKLRSPVTMAREMWRDLLASRELAWRLMVRDVSAQYRQSFLGVVWAFLPPIAMALVFVVLNSRKVINITETNIPYPAFVMFGTVLWQVFVDSLNAPLKVVTAAKPMLAKINFPKEALILSGLGQTLFNLSIKLVILMAVVIIFKIPVTLGVPLSILAILDLVLLGTMFGLLITPVGVLYTDIAQGLSLVTGLWFFLTPVVYPPPTSFPFSLLATLNPVSPILVAARDLATEGVLHNPMAFLVVTLLMFVVLLATWVVYRLAIPILVERMSA